MESGPVGSALTPHSVNRDVIYQLIYDLSNPDTVERALHELSLLRESDPDLAPILWHSAGTVSTLLQEIVAVYPLLSPPRLSAPVSERVCNSLALLQCLASHSATKRHFLRAYIPLLLYPFLSTTARAKEFEYLRLTSLGVIGALVKGDDNEVINFLLSTEIVPLSLRIMETGSELSRTVSAFILQRIIYHEPGLNYVCHGQDRFMAVNSVLSALLNQISRQPSLRILSMIIRIYRRLADSPVACLALKRFFPEVLISPTLTMQIRKDPAAHEALMQTIQMVGEGPAAGMRRSASAAAASTAASGADPSSNGQQGDAARGAQGSQMMLSGQASIAEQQQQLQQRGPQRPTLDSAPGPLQRPLQPQPGQMAGMHRGLGARMPMPSPSPPPYVDTGMALR